MSDRNGKPLRPKSERHVNMCDLRKKFGVRWVECKMEKRVLE